MILSTYYINWAEAQNFFGFLPVLIIIIWLLIKKYIWQKKASLELSSKKYLDRFLLNFSLFRKKIKIILLVLAFFFMILALARPQWDASFEVVKQEGRDLIIALDISRSMLAQDLEPNRLEFAKNKIKNLVQQLKSDRVGLIVFSGSAIILCPLTADIGAFLTFLDSIDSETISSGTTAIDVAIKKAIDIFEQLPARKSKLLLILTDGEDFSNNLVDIGKKSKSLGLNIFTLGIATLSGAPIPVYDEEDKQIGHQKDEKGKVVISRLNENILQQLSSDTSGTYIRATKNGGDIQQLKEQVLKFEKNQIEDKSFMNKQEKFYYFALVSLICLLLDWLI